MTREQIKLHLIENGVEKPSEGLVTAILNSLSSEIAAATKSASEAVESKYKGYHSPDDYKKITDEIESLKGVNAKQARMSKLTEAGISKKYLDYADNKIGVDEADYDKRLKQFVKDNPELCGTSKEKVINEVKIESLKGGSNETEGSDNSDWNNAFKAAVGINNNNN